MKTDGAAHRRQQCRQTHLSVHKSSGPPLAHPDGQANSFIKEGCGQREGCRHSLKEKKTPPSLMTLIDSLHASTWGGGGSRLALNLWAQPLSQHSGGTQVKQWAHCAAHISSTELAGSLTGYICIVEVRYDTRLPVFWVALQSGGLTDGHKRPQVDSFLSSEGRENTVYAHYMDSANTYYGKMNTTPTLSGVYSLKGGSIGKLLASTCEWAETHKHKRVHMFAGCSSDSTPKPPGFNLRVMA